MTDAVGWIKDLDAELAKIAVVTEKSGSSLEKVYGNIIQGAADMRVAAKEYASASLIFYQQGLNDQEVERRTQITIQAAKAAGQSVDTMASQLTAIWNSYRMVGEEQQRAASVGAKLAASTAVDFADIAKAMQITAAAAEQVGVTYDSLSAIIATVGDATQQSASVIGNAYKTIFARIQQLTTDGTDGEITLNNVSSKLQALGMNVVDANGKLRNMDTIIREVGQSWSNYSEEQQIAIAQIAGGARQYGQFITLMNNFPKYLQLTKIASEETGETLVNQFIAARDTIEEAAENSKEAWSRALSNLFDADGIKGFYHALEDVGDLLGTIIKTVGGIPGILAIIGAIFQRQIADKILSTGIGIKTMVQNLTPAAQKNTIRRENAEEEAIVRQTNAKMVRAGLLDSNDAAASMLKLKQANQLKEIMVDINRLQQSGNALQRQQGQVLAASLQNSTAQYQNAVDKTAELTRGMQAAANEAKNFAQDVQLSEDRLRFLNEEQSMILIAQREIVTNMEAEIPILETKLEMARAIAEQKKAEAEIEKNKLTDKGLEVGVKLNTARQQRGRGTPDQQRTNEQSIASLKQYHSLIQQQIGAYNNAVKAQDKVVAASEKALQSAERRRNAAQEIVNTLEKEAETNQKNQVEVANLETAFLRAGEALGKGMLNGVEMMPKILDYLKQQIQNSEIDETLKQEMIRGLTIDPNNASIQNIGTAIANTLQMAQESGIDIKVDPKNFQLLSGNAQQVAQALRNIAAAGGEAGQSVQGVSMNGKQLTQTLVGMATSSVILVNGLSSMVDGFVKGEMSAGKFLSSLIMMAPTFVNLVSSIGAIPAVAKSAAASNVLLEGSIFGVKIALDAATLGITAIITGIMILIGAIIAFIKHEEALREEEIKTAQDTKEMADSMRDLTSTVNESVTAYREATEGISALGRSTQEYAEKAEAATEAAQSLINALRDSENLSFDGEELAQQVEKALNIAKYTGDWDELDDTIDRVQKKALMESVEANKKAGETAQIVLERSLKESTTSYVAYDENGQQTTRRLKRIDAGASSKDEIEAATALENLKEELNHITGSEYGISINTDGSLEEQIEAYKEALKLQDEMNNTMTPKEQKESEIYQNLTNWINESAEAYQAYTEAVKGSFEEQKQLLSLDPEAFAEAMDIDVSKIEGIDNIEELLSPEGGFDNLQDYENWKEAIRQVGEQAGWTEQQIESMINGDENTTGNQMASDFIADQVETAKAVNEAQAQMIEGVLNDTYSSLKEAGLEQYFDDLVIDPTLDEEALWKSIEEQIKKFESKKLAAELDVEVADITYSEKQKIVDGLSVGDTISKEDFDKLGQGYEGFFKLMEDGTYQLIQDAQLLEDQIESTRQKSLLDHAVDTAADAQQYQTSDPALYAEMMNSANAAQQQILASADSLRELDTLYVNLSKSMAEAGVDGASYTAFSQALIGLASQFENTADECAAYQFALRNGNEEQIKMAESALRIATRIGEAAEKYDLNTKSLEIQAGELKEVNKEMDLTDEQLAEMAINNQRLNKGITTLTKNWKEWSKELKKSDKTTQDYSDTAADLSDAVADIVGWYEELKLSSKFIEENFDLIEGAAEGDTSAILKLGAAVAQESVANMQLDKSLVNVTDGFDKTNKTMGSVNTAFEEYWQSLKTGASAEEAFVKAQSGVANGFALIQQNMDTLLADPNKLVNILGGPEGYDQFISDLNAMASATGMTAEQMQSMLSSVGVTADVETDYQEQQVTVPTYYEDYIEEEPRVFTYTDGDGKEYHSTRPRIRKVTIPGEPMKTQGWVGVARIKMEGPNGSSADVPPLKFHGKVPPSTSAKSGGSSGGGGGSSKKVTPKKREKSKGADTYKTRYKTLENYTEEYDSIVQHLNNTLDDAWGPKRLEQMKKYQQALLNSAKIQAAMIKRTKEWHDVDKEAFLETDLGKYAEFTGGRFSDLANPQQLYDLLHLWEQNAIDVKEKALDEVDKLYAGTTKQEEYDAEVEAIEERFNKTKEGLGEQEKALKQFLETHDKLREEVEKQIEAIRTYVSSRVQEIQYDLELKLKIPEKDLKRLERLVDRIGDIGIISGHTFDALDKVFSDIAEKVEATEGAGYDLIKFLSELNPDDEEHKKKFIEDFGYDAWEAYIKGNGALPAEVMEYFDELIENLYDYVEDIYDNSSDIFDDLIREVEIFFEQFDEIADKLETQISRLDMLDALIDISPYAQAKRGRDLKAETRRAREDNAWTQANLADSRYTNAKEYYDALDRQYKELETELSGIGRGEENDDERKRVQFEMNKINEARKDAYDDMTAAEQDRNAKIAEAAEIMRENLMAAFDDITADFEEGLNGMFSTLDDAIAMFDQKEELRDWYLDDFEKGFAFDDLDSKIQDAIEDTTDPKKLEALQKFQERINELRESGKDISQEEMDIENKRLEILLMEQDIENSRQENAKTTMRLARDASGNYSYIYSADEKNNEDKADELRNLKKELYELEKQAMRSTDKMYYQAYKELQEFIRAKNEALRQGDEQYAAMMEEKIKMAQEKLDRIVADNERYTSMMAEDFGEMATETNGSITAIIGGYEDLRSQHEDYKDKAVIYNQQLEDAAKKMQQETSKRLEELGIDYENLEGTVKTETSQMIQENEELRVKIKELKDNAASYFKEFENKVVQWRQKTNEEIQKVIDKIKALQKAMEDQKQANTEGAAGLEYDENTDYAALILNGITSGVSREQIEEWYRLRGEKIEAGKAPPNAVDNDTLREIEKLWMIDSKLASQALQVLQHEGIWNRDDLDISALITAIGALDGSLSGLLAELSQEREQKKEDTGWDDETQSYKKTASGGLIKTPQVRSLAEDGAELVLNAEDTQNILKAVSLVRETVNAQIGRVWATRSATLQERADQVNTSKLRMDEEYRAYVDAALAGQEQNVKIEATFPGVSVASEIEEALNNLVVEAAQYRRPNRR